MLAKELIKILEKNPDAEVIMSAWALMDNGDIDQSELTKNMIFESDYSNEYIVLCADSTIKSIMKKDEDKYIDVITKPYNK